jgi:2-polyprenyl-6-methoxyphenol hydroxylase-like FAD-dependent oxidoreductase
MAALRDSIAGMAPFLRKEVEVLQSWDQLSLLSVTVDRLERWYKPGLLCIGDAAHAMSPAGGVGINLAIQDAVATANRLAGPLATGSVPVRDLEAIQERRMLPVRVIQSAQVFVHRHVINADVAEPVRMPESLSWALRALPILQLLPAFFIGIGPRPEHVRTANVQARS